VVTRRLHVDATARSRIERGLARVRADFDLPVTFPPSVGAEVAAGSDRHTRGRVDRRDLALQTLDPAGSRDLDQAFAIERRDDGWRVRYAIADVAAVVAPGGALDAEAWSRGVTVYLPDGRVPLHPAALSEGTASLLPGQETPALLWSIDLDDAGARMAVRVERALVRSRAQLSYADAQAQLDAGTADAALRALRDVGGLLAGQEEARGGVSLNLADQEVETTSTGYRLRFDRPTAVEEHNARLSLLTGMAAADLMVDAGVGVLRTLSQATPDALAALRATAARVGVVWPAGVDYAAWIRTVDPATPRGCAVLMQALRTFRGACYETFTQRPASTPVHAALAAPYAHVTAPLRRLVDRYAGQIALDLAQERPLTNWAVAGLEDLPSAMAKSTQRAAAVDRAVLDLVEAVILSGRQGQVFDAVAVGSRNGATEIHLLDPAIVATLPVGVDVPLGTVVPVRLEGVDVDAGLVRFALA
jgi:exoribonuclease R